MDNASNESFPSIIHGPAHFEKPEPDSPLSHYSVRVIHRTQDVEKDSVISAHPPPGRARLAFYGFWDKDPQSSKDRAIFFRIVPAGFLVIILFIIWCVLPIYWGASWETTTHFHDLNCWVVDQDGGEIGQMVTSHLLATNGPPTSMTWSVPLEAPLLTQSSEFENAVVQENAWVVVQIHANASSNLDQAIATANGSYNGTLAITVWVNEARNQNTYRIVSPLVTGLMDNITHVFAQQKATQLSPSVNATSLLLTAPQTVAMPIYYFLHNTRPFDVPVVSAVNFLGMIYLTIISFVAAMLHHSARTDATSLHLRLKFSHLMLLRFAVSFVGYFILSAFYVLLCLAFKTPLTRWYGGSGVVIFWMMAWVSMLALGMALDSMLTLLTTRFIAFFLCLWIMTNVSTSTNAIEILPGVFRYGYATPFYNFSKTVLTVCFNTRNDLGLNFGVQIAWVCVSMITMTAFEWYGRLRAKNAWKKEFAPEEVRYSMDLSEAVRVAGRAI